MFFKKGRDGNRTYAKQKEGLRERSAQVCTLSQNGYGACMRLLQEGAPLQSTADGVRRRSNLPFYYTPDSRRHRESNLRPRS